MPGPRKLEDSLPAAILEKDRRIAPRVFAAEALR
jgi:hypothetical protein